MSCFQSLCCFMHFYHEEFSRIFQNLYLHTLAVSPKYFCMYVPNIYITLSKARHGHIHGALGYRTRRTVPMYRTLRTAPYLCTVPFAPYPISTIFSTIYGAKYGANWVRYGVPFVPYPISTIFSAIYGAKYGANWVRCEGYGT